MRFKSPNKDGFQLFAVTGINTVSFAIIASANAKKGLLGFSVQRSYPPSNKIRYIPGFKVFRSVVPKPKVDMQVSTFSHPVQAFVWDDFTAAPDQKYDYIFQPIRGTPKRLDRSTAPIRITVQTEKLYSGGEHDVFFNRGVASSQAYRRKFDNKRPDKLPPDKKTEALQWLSRDLDDAVLKFINQAKRGDSLRCCFYEFRYLPVAQALQAAIKRQVKVTIVIDAKKNAEQFPRKENLKMLRRAKIDLKHVILRDANPNNIQHNKFIVLLRGAQKRPTEVWTGSTNMSDSGIAGQTNVGHWVRNNKTAKQFNAYWELIATNPGSVKGGPRTDSIKQRAQYRKEVERQSAVPRSIKAIPKGITTIFSPRSTLSALDLYGSMMDSARSVSCITLAFGINKYFKALLKKHTNQNDVIFMLLEKEDKPNRKAKEPFVVINAANNVYQAWGSFIDDPVYHWAREVNTRKLKLSKHVSYIHCKFLLVDPLGSDPIIVTGSANFSKASTEDNDENMLVIRGNQRVADIYFTEFNRLFNHYYFRAIRQNRPKSPTQRDRKALFLDETGKVWVKQYTPGKLRAKRVELYLNMAGARTL
jgi:phosphatidylserine/phosphatidylglycerophosphate/cardiolipin synthase-like enzyme